MLRTDTFFFISFYFHIFGQPPSLWRGLGLAVSFDRLLGSSRYKESPLGLTCVLELSFGETVKRPDVTVVGKDL